MKHRFVFKEYRRALLFFIITAVVILLFLPREGRFKYEFQKGKPWNYEDLVAPFDFPIYKSTADLLEEQKQINNNYVVYYIYDALVEQAQIALLKAALSSNEANKYVVDEIAITLESIYEQGILSDNSSNNHPSKNTLISVVRGSVSEDYPASKFFTVSLAYDYLRSVLRSLDQDELHSVIKDIDLRQYIRPNLTYDGKLTQQVRENRLNAIIPTQGMVMKDDLIITKGTIVSSANYQVLSSLKKEYEDNVGFSGSWGLLIIGQFLYVIICFVALFMLFVLFWREMLTRGKYLVFLIMLINIISVIALLILRHNDKFIYLVPFTIVPIYIATFFYSRPALFVHWMIILMIGNFVPNSFQFVFINIIAGIVAIWVFNHLYKRGQLFFATLYVFLAYSVSYITLKLIREGNFADIEWFIILLFAGNALLIIVLYQFTFIFEKLFGFLSDSRLIELSDTNQKLLRELAEVAPGTFQHSMQVANLAEAAIREINGNALLVRTSALYHDIGKMKNPEYFIENQSSGYNPHDNLAPEESARIIIEHVTYGIELARKYNLPEAIIEFINSHHGKSKVFYFYSKYKELHPDAKEEDILPMFTYPGVNPRTKEMAVVMIADACEAASRSLKEYTVESISNMVDKIVNFQLSEGNYNGANITLVELEKVKEVIKRKLQNIYHSRIEYPEMKSINKE